MIRVLVVDDHPFFRDCLVQVINGSGDLAVVGECSDGADAESAVVQLEPDVVLMDVRMTTMSGIEATAAVRERQPSSKVLILTSDTSRSSRLAARSCGAVGYLLKGADPGRLLAAIRDVVGGGTSWPDDLTADLASS